MSLKDTFNNVKMGVNEHSPAIFIGIGIIGTVTTTILACKATLKAQDILEEHKRDIEVAERIRKDDCNNNYTEDEFNHDKMVITANTAKNLIIDYTPSITLGILSIASILKGYSIISSRNVALLAAYNAVEKSFASYRERVRDELGDKKDQEFMHGVKCLEIDKKERDKKGKLVTKKCKEYKLYGRPVSPYARFFQGPVSKEKFREAILSNSKEYPAGTTIDDYPLYSGTDEFSDSSYNKMFLTCQQENANNLLQAKGCLSLNDVYDMLGFERTEAGQVVGWSLNSKNGDGIISFGLYKYPDNINYTGGILLDFNVDGVIIGNNKTDLEKI